MRLMSYRYEIREIPFPKSDGSHLSPPPLMQQQTEHEDGGYAVDTLMRQCPRRTGNSSDISDMFETRDVCFCLQPRTQITLRYVAEKRFLSTQQFPADASRGLDLYPQLLYVTRPLPSASQCDGNDGDNARAGDAASRSCTLSRVLWRSRLFEGEDDGAEMQSMTMVVVGAFVPLPMPLPDFSMPYNVIILVSCGTCAVGVCE